MCCFFKCEGLCSDHQRKSPYFGDNPINIIHPLASAHLSLSLICKILILSEWIDQASVSSVALTQPFKFCFFILTG